MKENERIQNRIDELIAELSECREDERNTQNQILQIISLAGTILGILLGATYINSDSGSEAVAVFRYLNDIGNLKLAKLAKLINSYVTIERIIFWLSVMLFCAAFTYVTALGINNVLRYYHIQNLEDRLSELIRNMPDDEGRNNLLHWNSYIAPIITMNPKHISSTHTALNYFCLVVAVCCIVLFSMGTVITLFLKISSRQWFDYVPLGIMILIMLIAFILFMRLT